LVSASSVIRAQIERHGSLAFSRYQELALYGPGGFYTSGGAGRGRDFITSPEVGPLFGAVVARFLDAVWVEVGRPDPFVVVEAGAGPGMLAATILAARPDCMASLRYVLVDRVEHQRDRQARRLPLVPAAEAFAASAENAEGDVVPPAAAGPLVVALETLPRQVDTGVIIANELLDNLVIDLVELRVDGWHEVRVGLIGDDLVEVLVPATETLARTAERVAPTAETGVRVPIQHAAVEWLREALDSLRSGRIVVFDYMRSTMDMAAAGQAEWLRTYRDHERGGDPLVGPGRADITCDVAIDQLAFARQPASVTTQHEWLRTHGIGSLVEEGRQIWHERASLGDLEAVRARSRVGEAEALTDVDGLGGFTVVEWRP
jgi:SAM-dependent MidA family methyltransferase